jgi:hypothetical protein
MRLPVILLLLVLSISSFAQQETTEKGNPLILIDTLFTYNESMILHPSKFISISTISATKATELYGATGRFGVIRIQTVSDIQFVRLNAILDKFNVEDKYRNLRVCIDRAPVSEPEKLLADIKEIRNVEIITTKPVPTDPGAKDVSYINIVTQTTF